MTEARYDFDVIQIGFGPVSKLQALLLERRGWRVGVFERHSDTYALPRAVCIDHELYRIMHAAGLGAIVDHVTDPAPVYRWFDAEWRELMAIDWTAGSVSGKNEVNFVHQPSLERALRAEVEARAGIDVTFGAECTGIAQDEDGVTASIRDAATGEAREVRARYLIGADGANSIVRRSLGIEMHDKGFEADWLVVDFELKDGLTAQDLGLVECGQYCNPERPTTIVPGGTVDGRICRRWEFMRLPHETREEMTTEAKVQELLGDWIRPDQGELIRHALYTFRSLVAESWREGRVFLAGDAAHQMPPFMGQGMCSGMRDAWNLAWKIDLVLRGEAGDALLDTYQAERMPHVSDVIDISVFLGSIICIPDAAAAAERDEMFLSGKAPPPAPFPHITDGMIQRGPDGAPLGAAGQLSPHGTVRHRGRTKRLDVAVPPGWVLIHDGSLGEIAHPVLGALGIRMAKVVDRREAGDEDIADTQRQILPFMVARGLSAMLVRPDLHLFGGAGDAAGLRAMLDDLARQAAAFGLAERTPEPETA